MYGRLKLKLFPLALVGLFFSFLLTSLDASNAFPTNSHSDIAPDWGTTPASVIPIPHQSLYANALNLEQEGHQNYLAGNFSQAITLWEQAAIAYSDQQEILNQVRVLSNLALAYHQIGNETAADKLILLSHDLLATQDHQSLKHKSTLAQLINHQGIIQLAQGKIDDAIANWQQAKEIYQLLDNQLGIIRTSINLASAFKNLGLYHRAVKLFEEIKPILSAQPDSNLKSAGLRSYGDMLRLIGNKTEAEAILKESLNIATKLNATQEQVKTLLTLGNTLSIASDQLINQTYQVALKYYQQSLSICRSSDYCLATSLPLQINLAQLHLLLKTDRWWQGETLISPIRSALKLLPDNQKHIYQQINFAHNLIELRQKAQSEGLTLKNTPSWSEIEEIVEDIIVKANYIQSSKAESYGLGLKGKIAEQKQEWAKAQELTERALSLASNVNLGEISYLWQWQLGRINRAQGNIKTAINNYSDAVETLGNLSKDLVAIDSNIQYSFHQNVEPVYRELINLLLQPDSKSNSSNSEVSENNLEKARNVIESLQLAELHNFFREACLDAKPVKIDQVDHQAAAIYPIILGDRLEIILSIPNQPLQNYSVSVTQAELEREIKLLRQTLVIRSRRAFYNPAKKLYNWLIRPEIEALKAHNINTIVVVPDGLLRNIPLSALYDGKQYLVENFSVAITSGLQLLTPISVKDMKLKTLAVGLTQERQGFSALDFVNQELTEIQTQTDSLVLVDQDFTTQAFQQEITLSNYPIVHIATHGQFSSSLDSTFLLAWDDKISINQLDQILQSRTPSQREAIELLVLSACETATGDRQAALGLAGMAVRAGARSTLATLWSVNDQATAEMMSNFYQQLGTKQFPKAEAVRKAQLSLLNTSRHSHPFYWAPYVLLGNWL